MVSTRCGSRPTRPSSSRSESVNADCLFNLGSASNAWPRSMVARGGRSCTLPVLLLGGGCALPLKRLALLSLHEVVLSQPREDRPPPRRPLVIQKGEPGSVPVVAFDDHVLAEHPLERETEAHSGGFGRLVEVVALPLHAAGAQAEETVGEQEH